MNNFYRYRPRDNEDRMNMIAFHKLEMEIDEANATVYEYMNKDHLNKTKVRQGESMVKRWKKESLRAIKTLSDTKLMCYSRNKPRVWLNINMNDVI